MQENKLNNSENFCFQHWKFNRAKEWTQMAPSQRGTHVRSVLVNWTLFVICCQLHAALERVQGTFQPRETRQCCTRHRRASASAALAVGSPRYIDFGLSPLSLSCPVLPCSTAQRQCHSAWTDGHSFASYQRMATAGFQWQGFSF